eukprot:TRINITY_DN2246_c0_g1_i4.p6 TRINITY_DN2246_c0_g1~~TRINITY_DN2246_c0_g1_i4.p6  ORF type:complete len:130 (-),score=27.90 TRINITY_DN2246_c0_g1_i4:267-656(-)
MSWQEYVDGNMMADNKLEHAAIIGKDDGEVWAKSASFPEISAQEFAQLQKALEKPTENAVGGIHIGGTKYFFLGGVDKEVIRGKLGAGGICIRQTEAAILIGIYGEGTAPSECNLIVENLGDYLQENGY